MHTLDSMQARLDPLFPGLMGAKLVAITLEHVVATMAVRANLYTSGGLLHGGACMAFANALGVVGAALNLPEGRMMTTTDSSTKFIAGTKLGSVLRGDDFKPRSQSLDKDRVNN